MIITDITESDIQESFIELKCSKKLPLKLQEWFHNQVAKNKTLYTDRKNHPLTRESLLNIYYLKKFEKVFSDEAVDIWSDLCEKHKKGYLYVANFFLMAGSRITYNESYLDYREQRVDKIRALRSKTEDFLECLKKNKELLHEDGDVLEHCDYGEAIRMIPSQTKNIIVHVEDFLEEVIENYEVMNAGNHQAYPSKIVPYSRKNNIEDSEVIFFIKRIHVTMKLFLKKPYHDYVATFINLAFDTERDYSSIAQIVRKR